MSFYVQEDLQEDRAKRMQLTADVIDDVLRELETSNTTDRPVTSAIRKSTKRQLQALRIFGQSSGHVNLEQAWFLNCLAPEEPVISHGELATALNELRELGILSVDADGKISFSGDKFKRAYARYHAERAGISLSITRFPYTVFLGLQLSEALDSFTGPVLARAVGDDDSASSPIRALSVLFDPQAGEITGRSVSGLQISCCGNAFWQAHSCQNNNWSRRSFRFRLGFVQQ